MFLKTRSSAMAVAAAFSLFSCVVYAKSSEDTRFEHIANGFIEQLLRTHPETATQLGDHRYDARVSDFSSKGVAADLKLYRSVIAQLEKLNVTALSPGDAVDIQILENELRSRIFDIEVMHSEQRDPLAYNPAGSISMLLTRDFAPLRTRLRAVEGRLSAIPAIVRAAKQNLSNPPRVFTETAIAQNKGAISLVRDDLEEFLKDDPAMKAKLAGVRNKAIAALEGYGKWLETDLLPRSNGDFRIGAQRFAEKLKYSLDSDLSAETILSKAENELKQTQATMLQTALPLFHQYYPERNTDGLESKLIIRAVLDHIAENRPDNATIVDAARKKLSEATEFVRSHDIVSLPGDPVKVIVMPEYARGVAIAYCEQAGPLEKNGETFYAIAPTPADWNATRVTSFFKEYNNSMLDDLTVHEAMPGHYLQLAVANRAKVSTQIRNLFNSGSFVEGWATYAEQVMAENGFGGPETHMEQLKMRLRLIINAMLDQKIHAGQMTEQEAMTLMMDQGFQEEGEAAAKWRRAQLTSTQLSTYFVGNLELNALSTSFQENGGGSKKVIHDKMLSYGSIATRYIRQLAGLPKAAT